MLALGMLRGAPVKPLPKEPNGAGKHIIILVWKTYFEDIHAIDKIETNFVLKLSYALSKEFGFQLYKAANKGKDISREAGTYGMDICFPGDVNVSMSDGSKKLLREIKKGDRIITVDPATQKATTTEVTVLVEHNEIIMPSHN